MMPGVYILITSGAILLRTLGPLPYTLIECSSRVELWTKLYLLEPSVAGVNRHEVTYQCIEKMHTKRKKRTAHD